MKTSRHFKLLENKKEIETWVKQQANSCSRNIRMVQVHHTYLPSYKQWPENALTRQENMRSFHINERRMGDIAQHLTIFPDGTVATGRSMNRNPCGITGGNTGAICIEIYGNFDKGADIMTTKQREAVIMTYALLCKYFKLPVNTTGVRPHCWYTAGGTYLGNYSASRSAKTCPGTNFMGFGNTKSAFVNKFYPLIKEYMNSGKIGDSDTKPKAPTKVNIADYKAKTTDELNVRKGDSTEFDIVVALKKGETVTVTHTNTKKTWVFIKTSKNKTGWVNKKYLKKINDAKKDNDKDTKPSFKSYIVKITADELNIRKGPGIKYDIAGEIKKDTAVTIVDEKDGWGLLKAYKDKKDGWINLSYTKKI